MPKIIPLRELKNASQISEMCHNINEPIFITKNGASDMVLLSSDEYDRLISKPLNRTTYSVSTPEIKFEEASSLKKYHAARDSKPLYSVAEIKETLSPIFKKHGVIKAVLFGSYVKGTADSRSDIDLVVETKLRGLAFYGLLGDVSDALRFPVDLIEKRQIEKGSDIEREIEKTGVTIYG